MEKKVSILRWRKGGRVRFCNRDKHFFSEYNDGIRLTSLTAGVSISIIWGTLRSQIEMADGTAGDRAQRFWLVAENLRERFRPGNGKLSCAGALQARESRKSPGLTAYRQ
jgi:hypothetical protein